jgi:hypothetical protein
MYPRHYSTLSRSNDVNKDNDNKSFLDNHKEQEHTFVSEKNIIQKEKYTLLERLLYTFSTRKK